MKTILQSVKDEIAYPISQGFIENRLIARQLEYDCPVSFEIFQDKAYQGVIADCLFALITVPNISESDISISLPDRDLILKKANSIYSAIGEEPKKLTEPKVFIGG